MPKLAWAIAAVLTLALVSALIGVAYWQRGLEREELERRLSALQAVAGTNATEFSRLQTALAGARDRVAELERQTEEATRAQRSLEEEMRRALQSKDVTISELQGKLTVNILDRILFDSGEAQLKPEGQGVLRQIAAVLASYPKRQIHVIGHTDNVPIRASSRTRYPSNWELSTARATAAVRFLCEEAGVDARRLGAVGYGEFHPLADNSTADGRARNRRIAVVVLSEELAGSDAATPSAATAPAPSPIPVAGTDPGADAPSLNPAPPAP